MALCHQYHLPINDHPAAIFIALGKKASSSYHCLPLASMHSLHGGTVTTGHEHSRQDEGSVLSPPAPQTSEQTKYNISPLLVCYSVEAGSVFAICKASLPVLSAIEYHIWRCITTFATCSKNISKALYLIP